MTSTTSPERAFSGANVAVLSRGRVLTLLPDDYDHIPFPGHWDLPGGGREVGETPEACVLRELAEETGLRMQVAHLVCGANGRGCWRGRSRRGSSRRNVRG